MNRWPNGKRLTADDMRTIALDAKLMEPHSLDNHIHALHNAGLIISFLSSLTAKERHAMFYRKELELDSRTPANTPGYVEP